MNEPCRLARRTASRILRWLRVAPAESHNFTLSRRDIPAAVEQLRRVEPHPVAHRPPKHCRSVAQPGTRAVRSQFGVKRTRSHGCESDPSRLPAARQEGVSSLFLRADFASRLALSETNEWKRDRSGCNQRENTRPTITPHSAPLLPTALGPERRESTAMPVAPPHPSVRRCPLSAVEVKARRNPARPPTVCPCRRSPGTGARHARRM